jgi:hypothetical protein
MSDIKKNIYSFLNQYIETRLLIGGFDKNLSFRTNESVEVSDCRYLLNCWEEKIASGSVICVEIRRRKYYLLSEVYSLGILFDENGVKKLSQQEMWDLGF